MLWQGVTMHVRLMQNRVWTYMYIPSDPDGMACCGIHTYS